MPQTKYEKLCAAFDNLECIKENLKKLFIAGFSNFIECSSENIELDLTNVLNIPSLISYDAVLRVRITTGTREKIVTITGINFNHMLNESHNKNLISYNTATCMLDKNDEDVYSAIFNDLYNSIMAS